MKQSTIYQFDHALMPDGWRENARLAVDADGMILPCTEGAPADATAKAVRVPGIAIPGMPNCHSHAFQRAMAGLTEYRAAGQDNFWSWRSRMYDFALRLQPEDVAVIAAQLYMEMLKAGYTTVAEFHYLHNDLDGRAYADPAIMARAHLDAAAQTGIGMTLLPVLYMTSDFGDKPPLAGQRRFIQTVDGFLGLCCSLQDANSANILLARAFHSLRAVSPDAMRAVLDATAGDHATPIHIHAAEQTGEVDAALGVLGARPVDWLLDHAGLDHRWCLVHATHMTDTETERLAKSGATVAVCPSTEGNLGDGFFPLLPYLAAGGSLSIGTDSHISVSPPEELRWLEYAGRLQTRSRNVTATEAAPHTGARLWSAALAGGARASGRPVGSFEPGRRADILVLDADSPVLAGLPQDHILDSFIFAGQPTPLRHVMVGGRWVVRDGHHPQEERISEAYRRTMNRLLAV